MSTVGRMTGRLLRRGLVGFVALLCGIALFELVQPVIANSLGGAQGMASLLRVLPPAFQALVKTRPEFLAASGLSGYLSLGFTHPLFLVLTAAAIIGFAARTLAGEMEHGSIQLALARPVSRPQVYAARVLGVAVEALVLSLAAPLGMTLGLFIARPVGTLHYRYFVPTAIASALLFWAIGGLTLLGSAAANTTARAVGWATAALAVFYFVDYFASLWHPLKVLDPLSIFAYYDPAPALVHGSLAWSDVLVLAAVGAAGAVAGLVVFTRRDLPT